MSQESAMDEELTDLRERLPKVERVARELVECLESALMQLDSSYVQTGGYERCQAVLKRATAILDSEKSAEGEG